MPTFIRRMLLPAAPAGVRFLGIPDSAPVGRRKAPCWYSCQKHCRQGNQQPNLACSKGMVSQVVIWNKWTEMPSTWPQKRNNDTRNIIIVDLMKRTWLEPVTVWPHQKNLKVFLFTTVHALIHWPTDKITIVLLTQYWGEILIRS